MELSREALLKKQKLNIEKVELDDTNHVYVREMTGRERDNFEKSLMKQTEKDGKPVMESTLEDFRAKLAVNTVCDEKGKAVFQPGDVSILSKNMSAKWLIKIADAASKLNGITEADKEEMVKNSEGGPAASSSSDSAGSSK